MSAVAADSYVHSGRDTLSIILPVVTLPCRACEGHGCTACDGGQVRTATGVAALTAWTCEYLVRAPRPLQEMTDTELELLGAEIAMALQSICARRRADGSREHH